MTIQFQCYSCANPFNVPEEMAGTRARCNGCGAIVTIPTPIDTAIPGLTPIDALPFSPQPVRTPAAGTRAGGIIRPAKPQLAGVPVIIWILGAAGAVFGIGLIAVGIGVSLFMNTGGGSRPAVVMPEPSLPRPSRGDLDNRANSPFDDPAAERESLEARAEREAGERRAAAKQPEIGDRHAEALRNMQALQEAARAATAAAAADANPSTTPARTESPVVARNNEAAIDEQVSTAPINWQALPDPFQNMGEIKRGKISIDIPSSSEVIFPRNPSNFVLVKAGNFNDEIRQVFDLRTASAIGKPVKGKLEIRPFDEVFSPDGRYFAAQMQVTGVTAYGIWSFLDGTMLREVSLDEGKRGGIHFGAPHQLVIFATKHGEKPAVEVIDLRSGASVRKFDIEAQRYTSLNGNSTAISNGGKYFVALFDQQVAVYELASGERVGELQLPGERFNCEGLAFSHDGDELAAIGSDSNGSRMYCIDFGTGRATLDVEYGKRLTSSSQGHTLEYLPDRSALLYRGSLLLGRRSGAELWTFPSTGNSGRRILRPGKMLVSMRRSGSRMDELTEVELPEKALAAAADAVRSGGEAIDAALPPLTTADTFNAAKVTLPNGFVTWSAAPDPEPAIKREVDKAVPVASERDQLQSVRFAGRDSGKVLIHKRVGGQQHALEQVDIHNGSKSQPMPIPNVYKLLDVSPSGGAALIGFEEGSHYGDRGYSRIDLVNFRPNKHIAGWRPHAVETEGSREEGQVAWATFLDDDRVVTVNKAGKLTLWQMPDCKAIYQFEQFGQPLAVSPSRKYFAGVHEGGFRIFDASTGKCVGDLESPKTGINALRAAFHPEGKYLVAIIETNMDRLLVRWDMTSGKLTQEFPVKSELLYSLGRSWFGKQAGIEWRGDRYLMLDEQYLIDLENEAVVWRYHMQGSHYAAGSPDGKTWLVGRQQSASGPWFLKAHETPSLLTRGKTVLMTKEKQLVLAPGMKVRIHVDLSSVGLQNMEANVAQALAEAFATRGIEEDKTNGTVFSLVAGKKMTGETLSIESRGKVTGSFSQERLAVHLTLFDAERKPRWRRETGVQMRSYGWVQTDDARGEVAKEMYDAFKQMLTTGSLATEGVPTYVFADLEEMLAGESSLSYSGEGPPPSRSKSAVPSAGSSFPSGSPGFPGFPSGPRR